MAIHFQEPNATFIHIPKTGGSSFEQWVYENVENFDRKEKHCNIVKAKEFWNNLGFTFAIVRNPFDRYVSMFNFIGQRAEHRIERRAKGLKVKKGTNQDTDIAIVNLYRKGFDYWLNSMYNNDKEFIDIPNGNWSRIDPQYNWIKDDIDFLMKTETLHKDFKKIKDMFNIDIELPHINRSKHKNYKEYYNQETKHIVEKISAIDLEKFNYEF